MMRGQEKRGHYAPFVLVVSIFGLALSAAFLRSPVPSVAASEGRRVMVALAYDLICIVGMVAVLFPGACSGIFRIRDLPTEAQQGLGVRATKLMGIQVMHGHHPSEDAEKHELFIMGRSYCATCYGLLTGAFLSSAMITIFVLPSWPFPVGIWGAYSIYCFGVAGVIVGLSQVFIHWIGAEARFFLSFAFVMGTGLMLLATDLLTADLAADLFVVLLAVFWLLSRISLSHRSQLSTRSQSSLST